MPPPKKLIDKKTHQKTKTKQKPKNTPPHHRVASASELKDNQTALSRLLLFAINTHNSIPHATRLLHETKYYQKKNSTSAYTNV